MTFAPSLRRREALARLEALFAAAALPEPVADARVLLEEATGLRRFALLSGGDLPLGAAAADRLDAWVPRRLAREPVFRILGVREFWGLALRVTPDVLDPRADSEALVEAVLRELGPRRDETLHFLDLGTGSGALLCALLQAFPQAHGVGVDRSAAACAVARDNLERCGSAGRGTILEGDWTAPLAGRVFDAVVCNPPYIPSAAIATLDPEVHLFDPLAALDGGTDGLAAYRAVIPVLGAVLALGGPAVFEVGVGQAAEVAALFADAGFSARPSVWDLGGHERAVVATWAG